MIMKQTWCERSPPGSDEVWGPGPNAARDGPVVCGTDRQVLTADVGLCRGGQQLTADLWPCKQASRCNITQESDIVSGNS